MDHNSFVQSIVVDLSEAHENLRFNVRGKQIYYDVGAPEKSGPVKIRINSTQGPQIALVPGGEILFDGVMDIFVSNDAQQGKLATLLVSTDASIKNNPSNPLTGNQGNDRFGIGKSNVLTTFFGENTIPGDASTTATMLDPLNRGIALINMNLTVAMDSIHDLVFAVIQNSVTGSTRYIAEGKNTAHVRIDNLYLPAPWKLYIVRGGYNGNLPNVGNVDYHISANYFYLT